MWIKTKATFIAEQSVITGNAEFEDDYIVFRVSEISSFNVSENKSYTTVTFKNGTQNTVKISFYEFCKMLNNDIGANII